MAECPKSVYVGIGTDFAIAVVKLLAAASSGSSAMLAEGIHSIIDTGNASLIVWGLKKSKKPPDKNHPFGHGKELYFWALIVALLIFTLGGGVTIFEGVHHMRRPEPLASLNTGFLVLGIAAVIEIGTLWFTLREFRRGEGRRGLWLGIQTTKDPTLFTVLMNAAAGLVGVLIAFLGLYLSERLHKPWIDGFASILIGILLGAVAYVMLVEIKGLLVGEGADPQVLAEIRLLAQADPAIHMAGYPLTMYFGPHTILLALDVHFKDGLETKQITQAVDRLEKTIRGRFPDIKRIFIEAESFHPGDRAMNSETSIAENPQALLG